MKTRIVVISILAALLLSAQGLPTKLSVFQLAGTQVVPRVMIVTPGGLKFARLGTGITLNLTDPEDPVLDVAQAPSLPALKTYYHRWTTGEPSPTLPEPPVEVVSVSRNGLDQNETLDYTISGAVLTWNASGPLEDGDTIHVRYR